MTKRPDPGDLAFVPTTPQFLREILENPASGADLRGVAEATQAHAERVGATPPWTGYFAQASESLIGMALAEPGIAAVTALTAPERSASTRILEKHGFAQRRDDGSRDRRGMALEEAAPALTVAGSAPILGPWLS